MIFLLDLKSVWVDFICDVLILMIFCDIYDFIIKKFYMRDLCYVVKKVEVFFKLIGIVDMSYWGFEMEFFFFNDIWFD